MNKINNNNRINLLNFKSKYYTISLQINELVGGKENYEKVYNCITRVRFKIKDKSKVKIDELKKINLVKSVVWAEDELQVIVGRESPKIKEELKKINLGYYDKEETGFDVKKPKNKINILSIMSGIIACLNNIRITFIN